MTLLRTRRFLPLFVTQFLGAFNDNLLKNALLMLITYRLAADNVASTQMLVTLAAGLFILPFFLFSATAGQLADKYDRARLTRIIKAVEIVIMLFAIAGFYLHHTTLLMMSLFSMGVHSAFFGPIKYALLPQHLASHELLSGNAWIEAGTFLAILLGTLLGGLLILHDQGVLLIACALMVVAITGYVSSRLIPAAAPPQPGLSVNWNILQETGRIIAHSRRTPRVFHAILGISWFWLVGATFLSQFPAYAKDILHADETVVTLFLTLFSVGIAVGSFVCSRLLRGAIRTTYVPLAAVGMGLFGIDLALASQALTPAATGVLADAGHVLANLAGWRLVIDLFLLAVCGGLYIVPLYTLMQRDSDPNHRARTVASNNVMNSLFMVLSTLAVLVLLKQSVTIPHIFLIISVANLIVAALIRRLRG